MRDRIDFGFRYLKSRYHWLMSRLSPKLWRDEQAVIRYYRKKSGGSELDLSNPRTFSEKLQWYKLNARNPLMQICADKYAVREYIQTCGYGHLLNDVLGVYTSVDQIDLNRLPDRFVLKAAHGSAWNIIVRDKSQLKWNRERKMLKSWLQQDISWSGREWVYKDMPKLIIAERYLEDESGGLQDYKFFCFNGKPTYMQLEVGRYGDQHTRNFYDMDWQLMPFGKELPHNPDIVVEKPALFDEMKAIAADLSQPFQFVRVDLYQVDGKVHFGELTFFPAGGAPDFVPASYDAVVGAHWTLEN